MGRAADIVDQHIDAAEFLDAGRHHGGDRGVVGDVALLQHDLAANGFHAFDRLGGAVEITVDAENLGAFLGKAHRGGAAVAPAGTDAAGAGDNRNASLQASAHDFAPAVSFRAGANLYNRIGLSTSSALSAAPLGAISARMSTSRPSSGIGAA